MLLVRTYPCSSSCSAPLTIALPCSLFPHHPGIDWADTHPASYLTGETMRCPSMLQPHRPHRKQLSCHISGCGQSGWPGESSAATRVLEKFASVRVEGTMGSCLTHKVQQGARWIPRTGCVHHFCLPRPYLDLIDLISVVRHCVQQTGESGTTMATNTPTPLVPSVSGR